MDRTARASVEPVRQRTQYSCMAASMAMCLRANGHKVVEDEVNRVLGARPMQGAAWEQILATAQHYGCRATLTMPATVEQLKAWTDQKVPVMIAWNPEGRPWSHASTVFDVRYLDAVAPSDHETVQGDGPGLYVYVADPNIPNPKKTVRVVSEDVFYSKWYEKFPDYLVRRPACAIEREITETGQQVMPRDPHDVQAFVGFNTRTASNTHLAYEAYVDNRGYAHDDEGNSWFVGKEYAGYTGHPRGLPLPREQAYRPRSTPASLSPDAKQKLEILDRLLAKRSDRFIQSIRDQVAKGRTLSEAQLKAVRQNLYRNRMKPEADHFRTAADKAAYGVSVKRLSNGDVVVNAGPSYQRSAMMLLQKAGWDDRLVKNVAGSWILPKETVTSVDEVMRALASLQPVQKTASPPKSKYDRILERMRPFGWATPAPNVDGSVPQPWRVAHADRALAWLKSKFPSNRDIYTSHHDDYRGRTTVWVGLRDNRNKVEHLGRIKEMADVLSLTGWDVARDRNGAYFLLMDDIQKNALRKSARTVKDRSGRTWGPKRGLEGPFVYRDGRVLYYDRREKGGTYYDPTTDMYLDHQEAARVVMAKPKPKTVTPRDPAARQRAEQTGTGGAGRHHTRDRDVAKGRSRRVKHKNRQQWTARVHRLAQVYVSAARADYSEWQALVPGSDVKGSKEQKALQAFWNFTRGEMVEAVTLDDAIEMVAWDMGYQGRNLRFAPGLLFLAQIRRRNVNKMYRDGQRAAAENKQAAYSGNPDGKPIYDVAVDHGEKQPLSGGHDIMKRLQDRYRIEQGHSPRDGNPQLTNETATQHRATDPPTMRLQGRYVEVNEAFAQKIKVMHRRHIVENSPRGGFTLVHPEADNDAGFAGSSDYDFYFHPSRKTPGWWTVGYTPGYLLLLQKDGDKMRAKTVRQAAEMVYLVILGPGDTYQGSHVGAEGPMAWGPLAERKMKEMQRKYRPPLRIEVVGAREYERGSRYAAQSSARSSSNTSEGKESVNRLARRFVAARQVEAE